MSARNSRIIAAPTGCSSVMAGASGQSTQAVEKLLERRRARASRSLSWLWLRLSFRPRRLDGIGSSDQSPSGTACRRGDVADEAGLGAGIPDRSSSTALGRSVRREDPFTTSRNLAGQRQSAHAATTTCRMHSRPCEWVACNKAGAGGQVPARDPWCGEKRSCRFGPACRAGVRIAVPAHGLHRREWPACVAQEIIGRHRILSHNPRTRW